MIKDLSGAATFSLERCYGYRHIVNGRLVVNKANFLLNQSITYHRPRYIRGIKVNVNTDDDPILDTFGALDRLCENCCIFVIRQHTFHVVVLNNETKRYRLYQPCFHLNFRYDKLIDVENVGWVLQVDLDRKLQYFRLELDDASVTANVRYLTEWPRSSADPKIFVHSQTVVSSKTYFLEADTFNLRWFDFGQNVWSVEEIFFLPPSWVSNAQNYEKQLAHVNGAFYVFESESNKVFELANNVWCEMENLQWEKGSFNKHDVCFTYFGDVVVKSRSEYLLQNSVDYYYLVPLVKKVPSLVELTLKILAKGFQSQHRDKYEYDEDDTFENLLTKLKLPQSLIRHYFGPSWSLIRKKPTVVEINIDADTRDESNFRKILRWLRCRC